ncbi:Aminoglycoside phosphotransferase (APT) family kinase protein OS=Streptomyces griseomycini OX=66895 GN=FHS37_003621 PE=4 SV=1 [Streptomyces griseomycini]
MCAVRTRPDEVDIDAALVGRLVAGRFPRRAGLPVERLRSSGTENAMFRLGPDPVVRLPRYPGAVEGVAHEQRWLPRLGPLLPLSRDAPTREAIAHLTGRIDTAAVADLWEEALGVPEHTGAPVCAHR